MSTPSTASEYLLLIRNTGWYKGFSPAEIRKLVDQFGAWVDRMTNERKVQGAFPLAHEGKIVACRKAVMDGPFAEAKEAVAGYILVRAHSLDEAVEIAKSAPCLEYGEVLEVRPIVREAPEFQIARQLTL
jgi:hypothetical protein